MCTFCFVWDAVLVHSAAQSQCDTVVVADFFFFFASITMVALNWV